MHSPLRSCCRPLGVLGEPPRWPSACDAAPDAQSTGWLGEELPLPLSVRTPQDLAVKDVAEKQYLIFNLLAGGKLAWDARRLATAAGKWEALLRVPGLDPEIDGADAAAGARGARQKAGGRDRRRVPPPAVAPGEPATAAAETPPAARELRSPSRSAARCRAAASSGPGGAVVLLKRLGGETPAPGAGKGKVISQRDKTFIPHVLAIPVGTQGRLPQRGSDLSQRLLAVEAQRLRHRPLQEGATYSEMFKNAGRGADPVQHPLVDARLVFVVDTPYYAQADGAGRVHDQGRSARRVRADGLARGRLEGLHRAPVECRRRRRARPGIKVAGDSRSPAFLPDKSGKPRQAQLGVLASQAVRRNATASFAARSSGSSCPGNRWVAFSTMNRRLGSAISANAASISARPAYSSLAAWMIALGFGEPPKSGSRTSSAPARRRTASGRVGRGTHGQPDSRAEREARHPQRHSGRALLEDIERRARILFLVDAAAVRAGRAPDAAEVEANTVAPASPSALATR